jgi:hypothetical protein
MHISLEVDYFKIETGCLQESDLMFAPELDDVGAMVGDEVWVVGYPGANFDRRSSAPLVLGGVLASEPADGFAFNDFLRGSDGLPDEIDGFLVHSAIVPGSSGSMVISRPRGEGRAQLLGIVSRSLDWVEVENGPRQGLGLGIAFGAETIRQVLGTFDEDGFVAGRR